MKINRFNFGTNDPIPVEQPEEPELQPKDMTLQQLFDVVNNSTTAVKAKLLANAMLLENVKAAQDKVFLVELPDDYDPQLN